MLDELAPIDPDKDLDFDVLRSQAVHVVAAGLASLKAHRALLQGMCSDEGGRDLQIAIAHMEEAWLRLSHGKDVPDGG